jgi:hypothetical protein
MSLGLCGEIHLGGGREPVRGDDIDELVAARGDELEGHRGACG